MKTKVIQWRVFFVLWSASIVGILLILPYLLTLVLGHAGSTMPVRLSILIPLQVASNAIVLGIAIVIGLFLGNRVGLGAPILQAWLDKQKVGNRIRSILPPSILTGILGTLLILALELLVFQPAIRAQNVVAASALSLWNSQPAAWKGLLASFYGGIDEELFFRLFALTLLTWLGHFVHRSPDGRPSTAVLWVANILVAVLFGAGHLPITSALVTLTPLIIIREIVLNGLLGLAFGYLYWTRGIESAIVAHFSADLILHVVLAF